ncbi:hypothetical protein KJ582_01765 [bacterium]|nr:hypothetical protein [bacterium]
MVPKQERKVELRLRFAEFKGGPVQKTLVVGKKAPITLKDAKKMTDSILPNHYQIIPVKDDIIAGLIIRKAALKMISEKALIPILIEEAKKIMVPENIIEIDLDVSLAIRRIIDLTEKAELKGKTTLKEMSKSAKERAEKEMIIQALEKANWNKAKVARQLDIDYKTLYYKIKNYGIKKQKN